MCRSPLRRRLALRTTSEVESLSEQLIPTSCWRRTKTTRGRPFSVELIVRRLAMNCRPHQSKSIPSGEGESAALGCPADQEQCRRLRLKPRTRSNQAAINPRKNPAARKESLRLNPKLRQLVVSVSAV